ncbi:MAG: transporter family protein [Rickettsiaceae bacterium]|jgi:ABC-2 type transport system ATP-binding protein|nr:transporter family protein [Rickettsiaceae bacterium]
MSSTPIRVENVYKTFGEKMVLNDVSLEVLDNEIFGFIGLNGIGKTTLIKIIIDLLEHDGGGIEIFGTDKILPEARKNVAYLPEKFQPSNQLKGTEFLKFVTGLHKKELNLAEAKEIAEILDLKPEALNLRISKYSKGMVQKLGLLGTFLSKAKLIILDEPMSGLDPRARIFLKKQLVNYKKAGNSIFFSSHILSDIEEICDRIAVLNDGKIVFIGKPEEFKAKHKNKNLEDAFLSEIGLG